MKREKRTDGARTIAYLPASLKRQAERAAIEMGVSLSVWIGLAVRAYLERGKS